VGNRGFGVRLFEIESSGTLVPLLGVDEDYFCGAVPNVGDTYAMNHLNGVYDFYSVQRRIFVDSHDGAEGWCVIVRRVETASQLENVVTAWDEDTKFWNDIDDQEREQENKKTRQALEKLIGKKARSTASCEVPEAAKEGLETTRTKREIIRSQHQAP